MAVAVIIGMAFVAGSRSCWDGCENSVVRGPRYRAGRQDGLDIRQFVQYQPCTPIIESLRGLLWVPGRLHMVSTQPPYRLHLSGAYLANIDLNKTLYRKDGSATAEILYTRKSLLIPPLQVGN